jgi:peptidoglycan-associated lipoprotein
MKAIKFTSLLVCALALTFAATGCKRNPTSLTRLPGQPTGGVPDPGPGGGLSNVPGPDSTDGVPLPTDIGDIINDYTHDRAALEMHTVHFDYDSAAIRSNERANVQAVADYMKSAAGKVLLIEGHCDERGTDQYNYSLGERRALAVRLALIALGADGNRITTLSYGRDKKVASGNDEASHARNRRGEFVVCTRKLDQVVLLK